MSVWTWAQTVLAVKSIRRIGLCKGEEKLSAFFSFGVFCCLVRWLLLFVFPPSRTMITSSQPAQDRYLVNHWPNSNNDSTFREAPSGVVCCCPISNRFGVREESQAFLSSLPWKPNRARADTSLHPGYSQQCVPQLTPVDGTFQLPEFLLLGCLFKQCMIDAELPRSALPWAPGSHFPVQTQEKPGVQLPRAPQQGSQSTHTSLPTGHLHF